MTKTYIYILILTALAFVGCADEGAEPVSDPATPAEAEGAVHRDSVPLSFEASLGGGATRAEFTYNAGKLHLSWSAKDALGVYIKTEDNKILRAGSIYGTGTAGKDPRTFSGYVLQKFEHEEYIYMHPDIVNGTAVNFEEQYGEINGANTLNNYLPIVWKANAGGSMPTQGACKGYVIRLVLNFNENPGNIRKILLHTSKTSSTPDRIFPRSYSIDYFTNDEPFKFASVTPGTSASADTYTDAISLNVVGTGTPHDNGNGTYTVEAYLASACVKNLNVYSSQLRVEVINHDGKTFASTPVNFKGQPGASSQQLLANDVFPDASLRKMEQTMSPGGITPTIINYQYGISSILGMWNEYGQCYDPNGLVLLKDGTGGNNAGMPDVLKNDGVGLAIHDRYSLTNSSTGTPTFTWELYNAHSDVKQDNTTVNNIDITAPTEVYVSFLSEYAWNQNLLGYYHYPTYPTNSVPTSAMGVMKNIIYPNLSKPGHEPFNSNGLPKNNIGKNEDAPMREYETVKLIYTDPSTGVSSTTFPAGTTIGFWGMIDVKANGFQQTQYSLLNWNQWRFFTNSAWNKDNSKWSGAYNRCNFFASGDICRRSGTSTTPVLDSEIIKGVVIYGFKDNVTNDANTAYSTCIFLVSASNTEAMKTYNRACFNIGCATSPYPSNIVIKK